MAFFDKFKDNSKTLTFNGDEKTKAESYISTLEKMETAIDRINDAMKTLNSNGKLDQVGSGVQALNNAIDNLKSKAGDLTSFEQGIGNIINVMQQLNQTTNNTSIKITDQEQLNLIRDFSRALNDAERDFNKISSSVDLAKKNFQEVIGEVNRLATSNFGESFTRNVERMNLGLDGLKSGITDIINQSKGLDNSLDVADKASKLQDYVKQISDSTRSISELQNQLLNAQLNPNVDESKIENLTNQLKTKSEEIKKMFEDALDINKALQSDTVDTGVSNLVSKLSEKLSGLGNLFPPEAVDKLVEFNKIYRETQGLVDSGSLIPNTSEAGRAFNELANIALFVRTSYDKLSEGASNVHLSHENLAVDFAMMGQNKAIFESINEAIKNVSQSLSDGAEQAKGLMSSITDPSKLQNSGITSLYNDLKELQKIMIELKSANDQEGLMFTNPKEFEILHKRAYGLQASINSKHATLLREHGGDFVNSKELDALTNHIGTANKEMAKSNNIIKSNLRDTNAYSDFAKQLDYSSYLSDTSNGNFERLQRDKKINQVRTINDKIENVVSGGDTTSQLYHTVKYADSARAGTNYSHIMNGVVTGAQDLASKARNFKREYEDDNSKYTFGQRYAVDKVMDVDGIVKNTQELAKLTAIFGQLKDELVKEIHAFTTTGKGDEKVISEKAKTLGNLQMQIAGKTGTLTRDLNIDKISPTAIKDMGKDAAALVSAIKKQVDLVEKGTVFSAEFISKLTDKEAVDNLLRISRELEQVGDRLDKNTTKTNNWFKSMEDFYDISMNKISRVLSVMGLGAIAGGVGGIISMIPDQWNQISRTYANTSLTESSIGTDFNSDRARQRVAEGNQLHRMSGGMIGVDELNNRYISLLRNVGGGYGRTQEEGKQDLDKINEETFKLSKVYNVSEGTMNDSVKTFYKDLGMSASEATYTIHSLAQTAVASNIPVEKYLKMVADLAQQYKAIGMDGKEAMNIMQNMIHHDANTEQSQKFTNQMANAMGNFADNPNKAAFYGIMSGQFSDPIASVAAHENRMDENFKINPNWAKTVARSMDAELQLHGAIGEGNENLQFHLIYQKLKEMGMSSDLASTGANMYLKSGGGERFETWMNDNQDKMGSPEEQIRKSNEKLEQAITGASGKLSKADRTVADLTANMRDLAEKIGYVIDNAIEPIHNWLNELITGISSKLDSFRDSPIWKGLTNGIGGLTKAVLGVMAITGVIKMAVSAYTTSAKIIKTAADKTITSMERLISALNLNTKAKGGNDSVSDWDTNGKTRGSRKGGSWWDKIKGNGGKILKGSAITTLFGSALINSGEYLDDLSAGKQGATNRFLSNVAVDSMWAGGGALVGGTIGSIIPGAGTVAGSIAGGYLGTTLGEWINLKTADGNGRGINDRLKSSLANITGGGSTTSNIATPISEMDNISDSPMIPGGNYKEGSSWSNLLKMSTAEASPSKVSEDLNEKVVTSSTQETEMMTIMQGVAQGVIKPEEYQALLNKSDANHASALETINGRLAKEAKETKETLHKDQLIKLANMSDSEKEKIAEVQKAVSDSSKENQTKLDEVINAIFSLRSGFSGSAYGGGSIPKGLGALARKYESNGDPGSIGNPNGHLSYGLYQIDTVTGNMPGFLKFLKEKNPQMAAQLGTNINSNEFQSAWKNLGKTQGEEFGAIQQEWIGQQYYNPIAKYMQDKFSMDVSTRSRGFQETLFATAIQHGVVGAGKILDEVMASNPKGEEDLIRKIFAIRKRINPSTADRYAREEEDAVKMSNERALVAETPISSVNHNSVLKQLAQVTDQDVKQWVGGNVNGINEEMKRRLAWMAMSKGQKLTVDSGYRSKEEQQEIWDRHKREHPEMSDEERRNYVALPGYSIHQTGMAIDVQEQIFKNMENNELKKFGLYKPLWNDKIRTENWHIETIEARNQQIASGNYDNISQNNQNGQSEAEKELVWFKQGIDPKYAKTHTKNPFVTGSPIYHILNSSYNSNDPNAKTDYVGILSAMSNDAKAVNYAIDNQKLAQQYRDKFLGGKPPTTYDKEPLINDSSIAKTKTNSPYTLSMEKISEEVKEDTNKKQGVEATFIIKGDTKNSEAMEQITKWLQVISQMGVEVKELRKDVNGLHVNIADAHHKLADSYQITYNNKRS